MALADVARATVASAEPLWWHPFTAYAWVGDGYYATGEYWHPYNPPGQHKAQDLDGGDLGEQVYAVANGTVQQAGWSAITGLGNTVEVSHGGGFVTLYAHLHAVTASVGQTVVGGHTVVGLMGGTGGDYAAHLHLEIWTSSTRSARIDPLPRVGQGYAPLALSGPPQTVEENDLPKSIYYIASSASPSGYVANGDIWVRTAPGEALRKMTSGQATDYFVLDGLDFTSPNVKSKPGSWFDAAFAEDNAVYLKNVQAHPWMQEI